MFKKFSVIAVVVVMLLSVFSVAAFADEPLLISPAPENFDSAIAETVNGAIEESAEEEKGYFNPMAFVENLNIMGVGMLGIFIVIGAIILSVVVLNKLTAPKPEKKDE